LYLTPLRETFNPMLFAGSTWHYTSATGQNPDLQHALLYRTPRSVMPHDHRERAFLMSLTFIFIFYFTGPAMQALVECAIVVQDMA
jgi:hypothetical protein